MNDRRYRAGDSVEDVCRACKLDRMHTVIVSDQDGRPLRVSCGYCGSEHNYRGGPAAAGNDAARPPKPRTVTVRSDAGSARPTLPLVAERERTAPPMTLESNDVEL